MGLSALCIAIVRETESAVQDGIYLPAPANLSIGGVICYDWEGDGHWQHYTVIVEKDAGGMPPVK